MQVALKEARNAFQLDEVPVGCVIIKNNEIIARSHNMMKRTHNQINHAEMIAIAEACNFLNSGYLTNCDMYVTLEPCNMCAAAISFARIRRLYCGALDEKGGGIYHNTKLYYGKKGLHHIPEHYCQFFELHSIEILRKFFQQKR